MAVVFVAVGVVGVFVVGVVVCVAVVTVVIAFAVIVVPDVCTAAFETYKQNRRSTERRQRPQKM